MPSGRPAGGEVKQIGEGRGGTFPGAEQGHVVVAAGHADQVLFEGLPMVFGAKAFHSTPFPCRRSTVPHDVSNP